MRLFILSLVICLSKVWGGPILIGNGDNGEDLQDFLPLKEGKIVETRKKAVSLLKSFEIHKIEGLGALIPEVENTKLYMTKRGLSTTRLTELGAFTNTSQGLIYARTMPIAYAVTRFFPASLSLTEKQLIALHIHEALHRSLPRSIRKDEKIVSEITTSITSPDASFDQIKMMSETYIPIKDKIQTIMSSQMKTKLKKKTTKNRRIGKSSIGVEIRQFENAKKELTSDDQGIQSMSILKNHINFDENQKRDISFRFDLSFINTKNDSFSGPILLAGYYQFLSNEKFSFTALLEQQINTLSNEELHNSFLGRDTTSIGLTIKHDNRRFFLDNTIKYTLPSETTDEVDGNKYKYEFGETLGVRLYGGAYWKGLKLGANYNYLLMNDLNISGNELNSSTGRNRVISAGPSIEYNKNQYSLGVEASFLLDSSNNASLEYLSDIFGYGVGQGSVKTYLNIYY